nr:hypothetical protein [Candidatus Freyarchaeota archaeon]
MALGTSLAKKLNKLHNMREVIDFINELEAKSYYVSRVFSDSKDSSPYQTPTRLNDLPFLDEDNIKISNFEKMIKGSNNFGEIGKFIERINCVSGSIGEKLTPLVCEKINKSDTLRQVMLCLNQIVGRNFSQCLINSSHSNTIHDYNRIRLAALIVEGLDEKTLVKNIIHSNRLRDVWESIHTLKIIWEPLADRVLSNLDYKIIIEKLNKTRNPYSVGNLLRTIREIDSQKADLVLRELMEKLRASDNLVYVATCFGGIANFEVKSATELLPLIIDKMNASNNLTEVGKSFRKISLANRNAAMELFIGLDEEKQKYLLEKYGRYLKIENR